MAVKFFGQYLVEQGIVASQALLNAIHIQEKNNLKLGELAVTMGLITPADIERVHTIQASRDIKLGDLLVEMKLLSLDQLNDVLTRQKNTHLYIGEALVMVGALTGDQLKSHLEAFSADQAKYLSNDVELPITSPNSAIWEMTADLTYKMVTRLLGLQFKTGLCVAVTTIPANFMLAAIDFIGDVEGRYLILVSEELQKTIARAILSEESVDHEPVEVLDDTVMEFVNVVCGNVVAKASQMGVIMNIKPPVAIRPPAGGLPIAEGWIALSFPLHISNGDTMELILQIRE
ncbi:MAG: chemotaxis protein CheX [Desulfuromonadaceae bacterium]|nr:chemotaxis protein CheX [Desulfuromonadaceae bacterium]MDD5107522.1 chemotaxis protein CheX [Desulfuromonadaceae bacterium]